MRRTDNAPTKAPGSRHSARSNSPSNPPRRTSRPQPLVPVVAIGDVHGCDELLEAELQKHRGSGAELILLGDLIDRAPEPGGDRAGIGRREPAELSPGYQINPKPGSVGLAEIEAATDGCKSISSLAGPVLCTMCIVLHRRRRDRPNPPYQP